MFPQCSLQTNSAVESSLAARSSTCTTPPVITSRVKAERNSLRAAERKTSEPEEKTFGRQKGVHSLVTVTVHPRLEW